jgi:electron transport complex protein RnfG
MSGVAWPMYRALVGIGLVCGALIVSAYQATAPTIRANRIAARDRAVLRVLPGAVESRAFRWSGARFAAADGDDLPSVFAGFDAEGSLIGFAVEAQAMGYQDAVRILWGYAHARQAIIGMCVLESRETPGLGDRVETDPAYVANFAQLDVALDPTGTALAHPIGIVKPGAKTARWQVDTISGATITSGAIARMVRDGAAIWVPRLAQRLGDFTAEAR